MSKCKFCDKEIIFIETPNKRVMPCEVGKVEVWRLKKGKKTAVTERGEVFRCETEFTPFIGSEWAYIVHWSVCPDAGTARKRNNKSNK